MMTSQNSPAGQEQRDETCEVCVCVCVCVCVVWIVDVCVFLSVLCVSNSRHYFSTPTQDPSLPVSWGNRSASDVTSDVTTSRCV